MQMAQVMGGYTLGGADLLRRAMGKKKQSEMDKQRVIFVEGAQAKGVTEQNANEVFDMMAKFAGYGFNKSHSAAYSVVAYQTAYLKAHYPAEFMAAVLTTEMASSDKMAIALEATRQAGIDILPPCVNRSSAYFNVENGAVRFGLGAIEALLEAREKASGAFEDLFEMVRDLDLRTVGKKTIEALACAGAMDMFERHRAQLAGAVDLAWQYGQKHQADKAAGQNSLFGAASGGPSDFVPQLPHTEPWGKGEALRHERDLMGFYVSGHPLDDYAAEAKAFASVSLGDTERVPHESDQTICGILTSADRKTTKSGRPIAFLTVEDTSGACEVVCFAQTLERFGHLLEVDQPMLVRGKAETSRGDLKLIAKEVLPMWRVREQLVQAITLKIDASGVTPEAIDELAALCAEHKGAKKLYVELEHAGLPRPVRLHLRTAVVDLTPDLMKGFTRIVGREAMVLETEAV
jgi:DNA polymerase-3 subunit alpha